MSPRRNVRVEIKRRKLLLREGKIQAAMEVAGGLLLSNYKCLGLAIAMNFYKYLRLLSLAINNQVSIIIYNFNLIIINLDVD